MTIMRDIIRSYPQFFFLNSVGGPSAVFNQRLNEYGMTPRTASEASLIFPRSNQYATFLGDRYHGVMQPEAGAEYVSHNEENTTHRLTLLINYWRRRPRESASNKTHHCLYKSSYKASLSDFETVRAGHTQIPASIFEITESFDKHLPKWVRQEMPPPPKTKKKMQNKFWSKARERHAFLQLLYIGDSKINKQFAPTQVVPAWGVWKLEDGGNEL